MSTIHTKFIDPYRLPPKGRFCLNCDPTDWNKFKLFVCHNYLSRKEGALLRGHPTNITKNQLGGKCQ